MRPFRVKSLLLGFAVVLVTAALARGAAVTVVPDPHHKPATASEELLSFPSTDHGGYAIGSVAATASAAADELGLRAGGYPLAANSEAEVAEQAAEYNEVVRHRGFRKAFLLLIVCGGLIRFLTSHTYLKFIADVLDPKASF